MRRGPGEGTIGQRPDGRYYAAIMRDGRRTWVYGRSRADVRRKLERVRAGPELGPSPTLRDWYAQWLEQVRRTRSHGTYLEYAQVARHHILPVVGSIRVSRLQPRDVSRVLAATEHLSPSTRRKALSALSGALEAAVRHDPPLAARNVARAVSWPATRRVEASALSVADARRLLAAAGPDAALYALALAYGMREGEILGLRWADVDLDAGVLTIRMQAQRGQLVPLKTARSRRTLHLGAWLVDLLSAQRRAVQDRRLVAGERWREHDMVFPSSVGTVRRAGDFIRDWHRLLAMAGFERVRFHTLRHTAASLLLAEGQSLFEVSLTLGHASIATTANIYGHFTDDARARVAAAAERALVVPMLSGQDVRSIGEREKRRLRTNF